MTREEAIQHGKEQLDVFGGTHREFIEMAIEALQKQKTARQINVSGTDCQCSRCMSWNDVMDKYCWQCGAKLGR